MFISNGQQLAVHDNSAFHGSKLPAPLSFGGNVNPGLKPGAIIIKPFQGFYLTYKLIVENNSIGLQFITQ